jgi:putative endonuclease
MFNQAVGFWGEQQAAEEYERQGYQVVAKNFRRFPYEIDIILKNQEYIVFCEVKTRRGSRFGTPAQGVTAKKLQNIRLGAMLYLQEHPSDLQPRMDVCEVYYHQEKGMLVADKISIIENAGMTQNP